MQIQEATNHTGTLPIGDLELEVTILKDGTPVISYGSAERFFGLNSQRGKFFPQLTGQLKQVIKEPVKWQVPGNKRIYSGFEADILFDFAETIIELSKFENEELSPAKQQIVRQCWALVRAFGKAGVRAVCYDAAGYLREIKRDAIVQYFNKFLSDFLRPHELRFAGDMWPDIYHVYGKQIPRDRPMHEGAWLSKFIDTYIYKVLPEEVMKEIRDRNPYVKGRFRKHKNHQFLSEEVGDPALMAVIAQVRTLLKITPPGKPEKFKELHRKAFPKNNAQLEIHMGVCGI